MGSLLLASEFLQVSPKFDLFFRKATVDYDPLGYQQLLAGGDLGAECVSHLINIPTGLGKTSAIVMAWLWNRIELARTDWPRRLVYCLPMRTLVEQTKKNTNFWLDELGLAATVGVHVLMGGEETEDWDLEPARPQILIGTQDMLLSRALNRGYGMSRYRWPMHFGLLNNDCLWVLDEIQLMGPGLATACQLEAFRSAQGPVSAARFNSYPQGRSVTWYASATANDDYLKTRDWRDTERDKSFLIGLSPEDMAATTGVVAERRLATKSLEIDRKSNFDPERIITQHKGMIQALSGASVSLPLRTLIICNTVDRAVKVHDAIAEKLVNSEKIDLMLMHSRFRPAERIEQANRLEKFSIEEHPGGQIIVATQVVEAGVDLSSAILWTEIAPLASLVQRLGRLNRTAEFGFSKESHYGFTPKTIIVGIEVREPQGKPSQKDEDALEKEANSKYLPYSKAKCDEAWAALLKLSTDASIAALECISEDIAKSIDRCPYSLQQHELLDFFDTDANLSLGFTDVSPFVRGIDEDTDIYVAWRAWQSSDDRSEPEFSADFQREELCPVSISKARDARGLLSNGWIWRGRETGWSSLRNIDLAPGMTILLNEEVGGYSKKSGWTGRADDKPSSVYKPGARPSDADMLSALDNGWESIAQHTGAVTSEWEQIIKSLGEQPPLTEEEQQAALSATLWHDVGKSHCKWQSAVKAALEHARIDLSNAKWPAAKFSLSESPRLKETNSDGTLKFTGDSLRRELRFLRRSFRPGLDHEVASALAFRQAEQSTHGQQRPVESLLAEYLIMSHHGSVRKVLRDEIPRFPETSKEMDAVRGVAKGDPLPVVTIGDRQLGCNSLSTDCRRMGRDDAGNESYTRGVLKVLAHYGPFRLAFFEALFRAADIRASIKATGQGKGGAA